MKGSSAMPKTVRAAEFRARAKIPHKNSPQKFPWPAACGSATSDPGMTAEIKGTGAATISTCQAPGGVVEQLLDLETSRDEPSPFSPTSNVRSRAMVPNAL
jgi:hypothetical protein